MNTHKFKFIFLLTGVLALSLFSCEKYLDVNVDPNQSTTSRIDLQLTAAQLQTAIGMGQRMYPNLSVWSQYYTGGPGVSLGDPDQHKLASTEGNEIFTRLYRSSTNLDFIIKNSTEKNYIAIAKLMKAYNFQVCVDLFGDMPYTEALKGDIADGSILHPKYDNAETVIYPALEREILEAITLISEGADFTTPGADDLIYGGHMDQWDKFAHTLLLKIYLRQGATGAAKITDQGFTAAQIITTNADAAKVSFPGGASGSNPFWNAAKSTALGNFYVATTTNLDYMVGTQDPRLDAFFDPNDAGIQIGLNPGDIENAPLTSSFSVPNGAKVATGDFIFSPKAPVILISAWEGNLLLAEASARGSLTGVNDAQAYANAVHESFVYLGLTDGSDTTYLKTGGAYNAGSLDSKIKSIALQKWVSMNGLQPIESWIEVRRFDTASQHIFYGPGGLFKSPVNNVLGAGIFPNILPYPENEESLNQSFPGQHTLTARVFWDKD